MTSPEACNSGAQIAAMVRVRGCHESPVQATLRLEQVGSSPTFAYIGSTIASNRRWVNLEGKFSLTSVPTRVIVYLEGPDPGVDLLVDHVYEEVKGVTDDEAENIILNPRFEDGLNTWSGKGCKIVLHRSMGDGKVLPMTGKVFASATDRKQNWNGIQQEITGRVQSKLAYEVTAIVRIFGNSPSAEVRATLWVQTTNQQEQYIGIAKEDSDYVITMLGLNMSPVEPSPLELSLRPKILKLKLGSSSAQAQLKELNSARKTLKTLKTPKTCSLINVA
ncbi:Endo-1-4-beta-xylanase A [Nymphaea thermarum]|nr:Endo-1-4-beta-xylanase A [Nymphaea thermarum]